MRIGLKSDILVLMVVIGEEIHWLSIAITVRGFPDEPPLLSKYIRIIGQL